MPTEMIQPTTQSIRVYADGRMDAGSTAAYLGVAEKTLAMMRMRGETPPYYKLGKRVFYKRDDLDAWIESRRATSTAEYKTRRQATA